MDPITLATVTSAATVLATEVAKGAAGEAGKDVWTKIKSLLGWKAEPAPAELAPSIAATLLEQPALAEQLAPLLQQRAAGSAAALAKSIRVGQGSVTVVRNNTGTISNTNTFGSL